MSAISATIYRFKQGLSKMHVFLSPHFDDVVGSCGGLMASLAKAGASVSVFTIMGGIPWKNPARVPKVLFRKFENISACRVLGAKRIDAGFLDARYRMKRADIFVNRVDDLLNPPPLPPSAREGGFVAEIAAWIKARTKPTDIIYAPSGLGRHIDHLIVAEAARRLPNKIIFYEEFYYDWKEGESMPGYVKYHLAPLAAKARFRAIKKYNLEMRGLFKSRRNTKRYFSEFRADKSGTFEKYSEMPHIPELIVSFTSFPARIGTVNQTIESILANKKQPDKIVLYLARGQFPGSKLPENLSVLMKQHKNVEVRYTDEDIRSFKKLVPALADFPEDFLITIDDDLLYDAGLIRRLWRSHKRLPHAVIAARTRIVQINEGRFGPYKQWKRLVFYRWLRRSRRPRFDNLATTGGGTLFPPHALHADVSRADIFMKISATTDDLWFWAMAVLNGTKTAASSWNRRLVTVSGSQEISLSKDNVHGKMLNDENIRKIAERYPDLMKFL